MDLLRRAGKFIPVQPSRLPTIDEKGKPRRTLASRLAYLRRPMRLRGNSSISVPLGVIILFPCIVVILILVLFVRHPSSPGRILMPAGAPPAVRRISEKYDKVFVQGCVEPDTTKPRVNGAFVVLARNKELDGVIQSIKSIERHFNRWYHYPYVFLNDGDFNSTFIEAVKNYTSSPVEFGKVGPEMWGYPEWVDPKVAKEGIAKQGDAAVMYGGLESYHSMCRFYSGFFYKHELLAKYEWYWRLEPEIKYFCDITYDPFLKMQEENKTYGFTIAVKELRETVPNIFRYASAYKRLNNITSQGLWEMFVDPHPEKEPEVPEDDPNYKPPIPEEVLRSEPGHNGLPNIDSDAMEGEKYNMCHFWSNFEIARLSFFRSKEYEDFFQMMDRSGGFWMERWGDAPIHSLAAGALLSPRDIHYFRDFGYRHTTIQHCPANAPAHQLPREPYLEMTTTDERKRLEEDKYWDDCLAEWVDVAGGWASP
ncbi:alpha-mannosyltransferase [Bombardia bombarda]|uniref:Alpha-mannosyltransferase n=1 Tax=Bombardia bombarda TaxID=252184 RepID=A0AA39TQV7_9PEZI|nr:alpha-mannosyltransferase [Bombardia bombarda]